MRALLIDPGRRTVTEVNLEDDDYRRIRTVLCCRSYTSGAHLRGSIEEGFDAVYVSDDPLEQRDDPRFWFQIDADRDPPGSFPIAGPGLAMGVDTEGEGCDVRISAAELAARITFTERKFRGFTRRKTPHGLVVGIKAPIIDGTNE
jgi:hypothetical protein